MNLYPFVQGWWVGLVSKSGDYQKQAAECLLLAQTASNQANKVVLLQMAATWLKLAEQVLKRAAEQPEAE